MHFKYTTFYQILNFMATVVTAEWPGTLGNNKVIDLSSCT